MTKDFSTITIGVTTYDKTDLLIDTLHSILNQTHQDFKILIGNDNPRKPITFETLGIFDSRITILNNELNVGEEGNLRALLNACQTDYFTWISDDDLYHPEFLESVVRVLRSDLKPQVVYPKFNVFRDPEETPVFERDFQKAPPQMFTGRDFIESYLKSSVQVIGNYGVFHTETLKKLWTKTLNRSGAALFVEYLILFELTVLDRIAYIPYGLVYYREHWGSWGVQNTNYQLYENIGHDLLKEIRHLDQRMIRKIKKRMFLFVTNLIVYNSLSKRFVKRGRLEFHELRDLFRDFLWNREYFDLDRRVGPRAVLSVFYIAFCVKKFFLPVARRRFSLFQFSIKLFLRLP